MLATLFITINISLSSSNISVTWFYFYKSFCQVILLVQIVGFYKLTWVFLLLLCDENLPESHLINERIALVIKLR